MGSDKMETKQVLVIRKDLNMRKGKIASQAAHASMAVFTNMMQPNIEGGNRTIRHFTVPTDGFINHWLNNSFTKICVSVDSEEELMEVYNKAKEKEIPCSLIEDNGTTEFGGVKTKTCVAIGPWDVTMINEITGHLKLL